MNKLNELSKDELATQWRKYFKKDAPVNVRRQFLEKHIQWQQNVKLNGGLNTKARNQLNRLVNQLRNGIDLKPANNLIIKSGTKLLREYKGVKHEVIVNEDTFLYQGRAFKSLSQIARHITGTQWNGKVFFGVKS